MICVLGVLEILRVERPEGKENFMKKISQK